MGSSVLLCALAVAVTAADVWTPPEDPDPAAILREAQADTSNQQYEEALAKHVWYHKNALAHQPAQSGVRRSFALSSWKQLADAYPPALFKLLEMREEAEAKVKANRAMADSFHDYAAISRYLGDETRTKDLFLALHAEKPDQAKRVYLVAQPALIKAKEYQVCMQYIEPATALEKSVHWFGLHKAMAKERFGPGLLDHAERKFTNEAATLVGLLAVNGRAAEASSVAFDAKKEWNNAGFYKAIDEALEGKVPEPWP